MLSFNTEGVVCLHVSVSVPLPDSVWVAFFPSVHCEPKCAQCLREPSRITGLNTPGSHGMCQELESLENA